jgi:hypothetical protein
MTFFDIRVRLLLKPRRILVLLKTTNPLVRKRKDKQPRKLQRKLPRKLQKRIQSAMSVSSIYRLALSGKHGSTLLLTGAVFLNFIFFGILSCFLVFNPTSCCSLLVEEIDLGDGNLRQVVSGLAKYCSPDELVVSSYHHDETGIAVMFFCSLLVFIVLLLKHTISSSESACCLDHKCEAWEAAGCHVCWIGMLYLWKLCLCLCETQQTMCKCGWSIGLSTFPNMIP